MIKLDDKYLEIIKEICADILPASSSVIVYGSRARKTNRKYSDIDIAIKDGKISENIISKLKETLEESDLPITVDLNIYSTLPKFLQKIIDEEGIEINFKKVKTA